MSWAMCWTRSLDRCRSVSRTRTGWSSMAASSSRLLWSTSLLFRLEETTCASSTRS
ncbi:Phosphatidylethanolamine-binding protein [Musa troglodytarum]|uniref:Phosphatidylethanolamine-binding protein n=1 Tax=Musa troglodytarum TaxID=320322 RepID=A0A9E7EZ48_9LILI|nr:Phosphatidylethanolamine-binding protein [Musa troglodytarum]URD86138.1 Phosphatidylethanolamine-binding protein [Musa troglodytarum]